MTNDPQPHVHRDPASHRALIKSWLDQREQSVDLTLDAEVAEALLFPSLSSRACVPASAHPRLLFSVDWSARTDTYSVVAVPSVSLSIVTVSETPRLISGFEHRAIGWYRGTALDTDALGRIIRHYWRRTFGNVRSDERWKRLVIAGGVSCAEAGAWRDEVWAVDVSDPVSDGDGSGGQP